MDYRRTAGFGATRASIKAGNKYENRVDDRLVQLTPPGSRLRRQVPRYGGFCDFTLELKGGHLYLIEVKSQWSLDAYAQLLRYAGSELSLVSRVCICKVYHPHVPTPEPAQCLPMEQLLNAPRGQLTIIPWSGRGR